MVTFCCLFLAVQCLPDSAWAAAGVGYMDNVEELPKQSQRNVVPGLTAAHPVQSHEDETLADIVSLYRRYLR